MAEWETNGNGSGHQGLTAEVLVERLTLVHRTLEAALDEFPPVVDPITRTRGEELEDMMPELDLDHMATFIMGGRPPSGQPEGDPDDPLAVFARADDAYFDRVTGRRRSEMLRSHFVDGHSRILGHALQGTRITATARGERPGNAIAALDAKGRTIGFREFAIGAFDWISAGRVSNGMAHAGELKTTPLGAEAGDDGEVDRYLIQPLGQDRVPNVSLLIEPLEDPAVDANPPTSEMALP